MTESMCDVVHPFTFNDTWSTNAAHKMEDYKFELRNNVDLNVLFARSTLLEHQQLTKFPETWHGLLFDTTFHPPFSCHKILPLTT
jgi:hypothetical protein